MPADGSAPLARDETLSLISADKVGGTPVFGADGHRLGTIETLMIDKISGRVEYAVLSFGGILGIGARHYPLSWQHLHYDDALGGYIIPLVEQQLCEAPSFDPGEAVDLADTAWGERVHSYYGPSVSGTRVGF
ncbi:PRC-barrel domain-containing protein [Roseomonas marmotae]|uniref:PRC-barrel domain-containing protein n=2 Tax=Roseomonas marmotae TaxID=2768161 RepID=A0ABS3KAC3_9PROT|nr:PRC-barrel domain-containing protein [Roseomonas marmotae]QTI80962.1 PRC-barrel domain-containing protein [Roseomonas marmotae]